MEKTVNYLKYVDLVIYRRKLGGEKGAGPVLSGGNVEGAGIIDIYNGREDLEDSALGVTLGTEVVSD